MSSNKDVKSGLGRREFLRGAGLASAAVATGFAGIREAHAYSGRYRLGDRLRQPPRLWGAPSKERFWRQVRRAFQLPRHYIHMNTGTTGSQPAFALHNLGVYNDYKSRDPKDWSKNLNAEYPALFPLGESLFGPSATAARQKLVADIYHAEQQEIVLSYNTTDGCNLIFAGTPWQPGDRIITTSFEHPALTGPIAWARDVHNVEVKTVDMGTLTPFTADYTVDDVLELFDEELKKPLKPGKKQYIAFSEIFYKNGLRLPVKELCALARSYGAYSIVDTAHGFGMLPIDLHDYGADFVAGAGHKWLCGGPGTGITFIRNTGDDLPPFGLGNFFLYGFLGPDAIADRTYDPGVWVQFRGESNTPALYAMTDSLAFFDQIGIHDIYKRGVELGNHLKDKIAAQWGEDSLWVQRREPGDPFATALTSFNPFLDKDDSNAYKDLRTAISQIVSGLADESPKIYVRFVTWRSSVDAPEDDRIGFRVSTHGVYNDYREVDYVFNRLAQRVEAAGLPTLA